MHNIGIFYWYAMSNVALIYKNHTFDMWFGKN
jgi:hypothetical protein